MGVTQPSQGRKHREARYWGTVTLLQLRDSHQNILLFQEERPAMPSGAVPQAAHQASLVSHWSPHSIHRASSSTNLHPPRVPYPEGGRKHPPKPTATSCPMQPLSPGRQIWGPLPGVPIISRSQHWSVDRAARHPTPLHSPGTVRSPVSCPPLDFRNLPSLAIYSLSKSGALDWTRWGRAGGPRQGQEVLSPAGEGPRSPLHLWIMGTRTPPTTGLSWLYYGFISTPALPSLD